MLRLCSHAKINWFLRVLEKRPDGFHNLETVFETLELGDDLCFSPDNSGECRIEGFPDDVPPERNLIRRAWERLRDGHPEQVKGMVVEAQKRLPRGGGLGGGSSNAAMALLAINKLNGLQLSEEDLLRVGAELGSDVPFFLRGGCALGTGRGEVLAPVETAGSFFLVLIVPDEGVSTGAAYQQLSGMKRQMPEKNVSFVREALASGDAEQLAQAIHNDFEMVVGEKYWYKTCWETLMREGCLRAFLCGSGSTVAGLCRSAEESEKILRGVHESCPYPAYKSTARALFPIR